MLLQYRKKSTGNKIYTSDSFSFTKIFLKCQLCSLLPNVKNLSKIFKP